MGLVFRLCCGAVCMRVKQIILASASPRRKEILEKTGLKFLVDAGSYEEDMGLPMEPHNLARFLSKEKAKAVAVKHKNALIIAADTIVILKGEVLGKPHTAEESMRMLSMLNGRTHSVITGFTVIDTGSNKKISRSVETRVTFSKLTEDEIKAYVKSGEPLDKAGAYGVQGLGAVIVKRIEGDYFNVMGLPISCLTEALKKFGVYVL